MPSMVPSATASSVPRPARAITSRLPAKNYQAVTVVVDPADYARVRREMKLGKGATNLATRFALAKKVFKLTHEYDGAIYHYLVDKAPAC